MDKDIEDKFKGCSVCQLHQNDPPQVRIHAWEHSEHPWQRVHIDHTGPIGGKDYLVLVDKYSMWLGVVVQVASLTLAEIISML